MSDQEISWGKNVAGCLKGVDALSHELETRGIKKDPSQFLQNLTKDDTAGQTFMAILDTLQKAAVENWAEMQNTQNQLAVEQNERIATQNQLAEANKLAQNLQHQLNQSHQTMNQFLATKTSTSTRRISKDPPPFDASDENVARRQETYAAWKDAIKITFVLDAATFDTEAKRILHICGLLAGNANRNNADMMKAVTDDPTEPQKWIHETAELFFHALDSQYETLNLVHDASIQFDKLKQANKPFQNFIAEFNNLARKAKKTNKEKVEALRRKVSREIAAKVAGWAMLPGDEDFPAWTNLCQTFYNNQQQHEHYFERENRPRIFAPALPTAPAPLPPPVPAAAALAKSEPMDVDTRRPRPQFRPDINRQACIADNLCFYCKQPGHGIDRCYEKKKADTKKAAYGGGQRNQYQQYQQQPVVNQNRQQNQRPYNPRTPTGKRITSAQSRERRLTQEQCQDQEWIKRILDEDEPLYLKSIDNSKSLLINTTLILAQDNQVDVVGLIDSGASGKAFASSEMVEDLGIPTWPLKTARLLYMADGAAAAKRITHYFVCPVAMGHHVEKYFFFVTPLDKESSVIFGLPWLKKHNPSIDWPRMTMSFTSDYCRQNCYPPGVPQDVVLTAPTIKNPPRKPDPLAFDVKTPTGTSLPSNYKPPSVTEVEDEGEPHCQNENSIPLHMEPTLWPDKDYYVTKQLNNVAEERRARMIRSTPRCHPRPVPMVAGSRRSTASPAKLPLPLLSVPLPPSPGTQPPQTEHDMEDIRMTTATSFVRFCRGKDVTAMRLTWHELDEIMKPTPKPVELPELSEKVYRMALSGTLDKATYDKFPTETHDFLDACMQPDSMDPLSVQRVKESDVEIFMKPKTQPSRAELLEKLPVWLRDLVDAFEPRQADELAPHRSWDHRIELLPGKTPPYHKARPMSRDELHVVRKWLDDNLEKGFIRESRSPCAAPLLLAAKPGGGVRICQDYRGLNAITVKNRYPLPLIRETLDALSRAKYFRKLDIIAAFNNLRIAEGHEWKTAFVTRFGLFETLVLPFGLCNAPSSFQHYINHALFDLLDKTCTAYLDDVLVYSTTRKEHRQHVREVVTRLRDAGLQIDIKKCEFEAQETKYLGLVVTTDGIKMDPAKVQAILDWKTPTTVKCLQRFLGFANFYRRFIQGFSVLRKPLDALLKKEVKWTWDQDKETAFKDLKRAFASAPVLALFDYDKKTVLETDASDWASGGVLSQYDEAGNLRPVAYFSAKHSAQECNYEIYDKELLAIIKALEEWRPELQGCQEEFEVITDHKNLEYFTTTKSLNQRQVRWSEFLSRFNFRIIYRPGSRATRPDALSRKKEDRPQHAGEDDRVKNRNRQVLPPERFDEAARRDLNLSEMTLAPASLLELAERPIDEIIQDAYRNSQLAQEMLTALRDPVVKKWPKQVRKTLRVAMLDCKVRGNVIYYRERLFVPPIDEARVQVIYRAHSTGPAGHPGRIKTAELVGRSYWWPRMNADIETYVRACELCVRSKASRSSSQGFLKPLPIPFRAWSDISVEYITPLPECQRHGRRFKHVLVVVCRLTKMRHFVPMETLSAGELVDAFVNRIYSLHGAPDNIVSDRGSQFVSDFWKQLSARLSVTLKPSSSFHPESDGQTEHLNAVLEQYLRQFMSFHQDDWADWLPLAEFASNNAKSETTGMSPFFANYGFNPLLGTEASQPCPPNMSEKRKKEFYRANVVAERLQRIIDKLTAMAKLANEKMEETANRRRSEAPRYVVGDRVFVDTRNMKTNRPMKKGDDKWAGPYKITAVYPRACALQLPAEMKIFPVFHTSLLRPAAVGGLLGQNELNEAESQKTRGRILERDDETQEVVEKWEFESLLDCHNEDELHYLVKWKHHAPTWQPAKDLKGQEAVLRDFHASNPEKPGPPRWARLRTVRFSPFVEEWRFEGGNCQRVERHLVTQ